MRRLVVHFVTACALLGTSAPCIAGPPFLTDDPVPVDFGHNEFYVFGTLDHADGASAMQGPAIEYNRGIAPNTQFHVVLPMAWNVPAHGATATGLGDIELGIKYRFVNIDGGGLQIGVFPMIELATGSARRGLGNGRTWYRLPLWVQKSVGAWTFDGGGGVIVNPAPGMYDAGFGGLLAQYTFDPRWTLGVEVFRQNALAAYQPGYTLLNAGGYLNFNQNFSLLFSAGNSVAGARHIVAYLALYWTWGPQG
ncbi:MAG: transporter [Rhodanobacteraceae bacterium]|nr:MAG: transporter [Rhodanobacteraceae bacterium]